METTTLKVGRHVAAVINQNQCLPANTYQVNIVMFFSIGEAVQKKKNQKIIYDLYDDAFEFWDVGPMHRGVVDKIKEEEIENFALYDKKYSFLDTYIKKYMRKNYYNFLSEIIRFETWKENEADILKRDFIVKYPIDLIQEDVKKWLNKQK